MKRSFAMAVLLVSLGSNAFAIDPVVVVSEQMQDKLDDIQLKLDSCLKNSQTPLGQEMCKEAAVSMRKQIESNYGYNEIAQKPKETPAPAAAEAVPPVEVVTVPSVDVAAVPAPYISFSSGSRPEAGASVLVR